ATYHISQTSKHLMEDMLHLGNEPKEEELLVKELLMCDKKNNVLFTNTGCFVLSHDFKLADESQVLLKVPRKNNMYSDDMKNIVPKEILTCLVAKATLDESMLFHRRLGHVNFKTINKFVKDNLVRVMSEFCEKKGIKKEFSVARTPQQNGVAERRNRTLIEAARTIVRTPSLSFMKPFGCHVTIRNNLDRLSKFDGKSDDRFFIGFSLNSKAFRVYNIRTRKVEENLHVRFLEDKPIIAGDGPKWLFDIDVLTESMNYVQVVAGTNSNDFVGTQESIGAGQSNKETGSSQDYILMPLWKDGLLFDSSSKNANNDETQPSNDAGKKDDEGRIDNQDMPEKSTQDVNTVEPSINTASTNSNTGSTIVTTAPTKTTHADYFKVETEVDMSNISTIYLVPSTLNIRIHKDHSLDNVIGDVQSSVQTRRMTKTTNDQGFISAVYEGKTHKDLHTCLFACFLSQEEPKRIAKALRKRAIGTKWIFRNKKDEIGIVIKNKERLVAQGYTQEEGIDYDEVFTPVARIEVIRLLLAYASIMGFMVYQMDVKSAFLYGKIEEWVYVCYPPGFEDLDNPDKVYKVVKALYGLHQALRAWYKTLAKYLLDNGFHKGKIDQTLFIKKQKGDILLVQFYVDDIIFGSTKKELCIEFEKLMHDKFQMSSMGELTFFLGLQVKQKEDGIFISQDKYVADILRKFGFTDIRTASTPMDTENPLLKDSYGDDVDVHLYRLMIGSVMYLTSSMPDIMFAVCACARFQVIPKVSHSYAVKRIFRYLKGQPKLGLWYPRDSPFNLVAYTDSDYAGASLDRKSTTGVANLEFYDKHNMVVYLHKSEGSEGFHQIVDFLTISHIRYALTESTTIHVSLIEQFWQTATASTLENGDMEITTTIDGEVKVVSEASIRKHLKLKDSDGISNLPTTEIFEQLDLIGSKKSAWEQFSSNIASAIICLATNRTFNFSKLIFDGMVKNFDSKTKFLMYLRFIQIFLNKHKRLFLPHKRLYIAPTLTQKLFSKMKRASKGYTGLDTPLFQTMLVQGQLLQGEGSTIPVESHHTPIVAPSTSQPHHSPTLRDFIRQETEVPQPSSPTRTHVADKVVSTGVDVRHGGAATTVSSLDQTKKVYGATYTKLIKKVKRLEDKLNKSRRKRKLTQGRHDHEMEANFKFTTVEDVSTANVLVNIIGAEISTASPKVKTAGVSVDDVATEGLVYIRRSATKRKDKEERQRIASVHEEASTFKPEEWDNIQAQIEVDEELAYMKEIICRTKSSTKEEQACHTGSIKESDDIVPKVVVGSSKRNAEEELGEESSKRQRIGEGSELAAESKDEKLDELSQEQL
ncbi:putative ribonuclease H-like domain-containing protein, partial [Tanacetum coccineum]